MEKKLDLNEQQKTPFLDAYVEYIHSNPTCFDVPGHRMGTFITDLDRKASHDFSFWDVNAPYGLDNLANPQTVLKQAEVLAAKAMHADYCFFSVNGTTGGILAMLLAVLKNKDKIILPRNVHKSVINGLILSGAKPVFVSPEIDEKLGIADAVSYNAMIRAMDDHPDAKAIFVINPTYFGACTDLHALVLEAHRRNMIVIADEAHGSNFYFSKELPMSAMDAGCDITSLSMHKNSGSLTQSSMILLKGRRLDYHDVARAFKMVTSTSPNSILLCSLDAARKEMVLRGEEVIHEDILMADRLRDAINKIPGLHTDGKGYQNTGKDKGRYRIDRTKVVVDVTGIGMYGYEVYKELRMKYNVQVELGEVSVILLLIDPGTTWEHCQRFIDAMTGMSREHYSEKGKRRLPKYAYHYPAMILTPAQAMDSKCDIIDMKDSIGKISGETVMAYPPGIPIVIPGEVITQEAVKMIGFFEKEGGEVLRDSRPGKIKAVNDDWLKAKEKNNDWGW